MSKEEKKDGIDKPKYDKERNKPRKPRKAKSKDYFLMIPEREATEKEEKELKEKYDTNTNFFMSFMAPWKEHRIHKYEKIKDALKGLDTMKSHQKSSPHEWDKRLELDRAIILNTKTKEIYDGEGKLKSTDT